MALTLIASLFSFSLFSPQLRTHPTITATPLGGGGPEGGEEASAGSGDAVVDDHFDDAIRRGSGELEELERLEEESIVVAF